jgi:DNA-directed RNA polymerase specialized sigma24 family protein
VRQDLDALLVLAKTDPQARANLARTLYFMLRTYFVRTMRVPRLAAEELTQSTIAILLPKVDSFVVKHPGAFKAYVFRTATQHARNQQRKWSREAERYVGLDPWTLRDGTPAMSSELGRRNQLDLVKEIIAEFGSTTRRSIEGWMQSDAWQLLVEREGVKRSTLRGRARRALKRIRERLRERAPGLIPESSAAS